jgi:hypothetical protein
MLPRKVASVLMRRSSEMLGLAGLEVNAWLAHLFMICSI